MKRFPLLLLVILLFILAGCGADQLPAPDGETRYSSNTSAEDCYLCGGGIESLVPSYWGQDNIALISLNTFEVKPLEINRYTLLAYVIGTASMICVTSRHIFTKFNLGAV